MNNLFPKRPYLKTRHCDDITFPTTAHHKGAGTVIVVGACPSTVETKSYFLSLMMGLRMSLKLCL